MAGVTSTSPSCFYLAVCLPPHTVPHAPYDGISLGFILYRIKINHMPGWRKCNCLIEWNSEWTRVLISTVLCFLFLLLLLWYWCQVLGFWLIPSKLPPEKHSVFFFFCHFRAAPLAYGVSQARGLIRAVSAGLHQSHSNARSELCLRPTSQLTAMLDP